MPAEDRRWLMYDTPYSSKDYDLCSDLVVFWEAMHDKNLVEESVARRMLKIGLRLLHNIADK